MAKIKGVRPQLSPSAQKSKKLKVAVVGVGAIGKHHARNYHEIPGVDLVAIVDTDEKSGRELANLYQAKYYKNHKEMLEKEKPDIVSVCVPTIWHHPVALSVIEAGSHLLVEKPITANLEEAKEIINMAKDKGVKLTVGHIERFNPVILKLKELIKLGKLGTIISVMARRAGTIPNRVKDANVIVDIGVHDIDLLNFILNSQPTNVYASGGRAILRKLEDYADIFLEYPAGEDGLKVTGHIQVNWLTPVKIRKLNVTGTRGYAVLNLINHELNLFDTDYTHEFDDYEDFIGKFRESKGKKFSVDVVEPLRLELEHFIASVINGRAPFVSGEDALTALRIAILATENIRLKDGRI